MRTLAFGLVAAAVTAVGVLLFVALGRSGRDENVVVPSPSAQTPSASPGSPAQPRPKPRPLFASGSVWNRPLADDASLDPSSAVLVKKLRETVEQNLAAGRGPWIQTSETSTPLYVVPADQPVVRVKLDAGAWATSLQQVFEEVPIPPGASRPPAPTRT